MAVVMGLFDNREEAIKAQTAIEALGISTDQMSLMEQESGSPHQQTQESWWEQLKGMFGLGIDHEDLPYYQEGVRRGGRLLTVQTDEARESKIAGIMADHNAVDIDTRAQEWRTAGWSPDEQIAIPVVEEKLKVGKRLVRRGGVRVYTTMTNTPVTESVKLREEHVDVTRRPASRRAESSDFATSETVIEMTESAEEPIVSKEARVVEEVVVQKGTTERTEKVQDTVRRQDVNVKKASQVCDRWWLHGHYLFNQNPSSTPQMSRRRSGLRS